MTKLYQPFQGKTIDLDAWTRKIIAGHFDPENGSPFWLEKKKALPFDPIAEVKRFDDLKLFGFFDENELKTTSVQKLIPRGVAGNNSSRLRVFETGGTLGAPKRIIDFTYRREVARWLSFCLDQHGFAKGGNWLHAGPAGPHVVGHTTGELAHLRDGICYYLDIDTRWIKHCIKNGYREILNEYMDHVLAQAQSILETQEISFLFTTPKLLLALSEKVSLADLQGVVCGGTHVTPDLHRLLRQEVVVPGLPFCIVYGNTIMGVAPQEPFKEENGVDIRYYGCMPYFIFKVVRPDDPGKEVGYGEQGRVQISTLTMDYFVPNLLERDVGVRVGGNGLYSWDGVANIKPYQAMEEKIVEGVY